MLNDDFDFYGVGYGLGGQFLRPSEHQKLIYNFKTKSVLKFLIN